MSLRNVLRGHLTRWLAAIAVGILVFLRALPFTLASSWNPTLLVNTESFATIDDTDSTANVVLKFGDSLAQTLTYQRTNGRFQFSAGLSVLGNMSGSSLTVDHAANIGGNVTASGSVSLLSGAVISRPEDSRFIRLNDTSNDKHVGVYAGSGSPANTVDASSGSLYFDDYNGRAYLNVGKGAGGTAQGWRPLVPAEPSFSDGEIAQNINGTLTGSVLVPHFGGRLTLTSGTPVMTTDVTSSTLYYTPYVDNRISLYDGTRWKMETFSELSLSLSVTSGKNYDVFVYDDGGTPALELSNAWTTNTTRADALARQDGVYVKSSDHTRLYAGTLRGSATNTTEVSHSKLFLWNYYNQVEHYMYYYDNTSHVYTGGSWRYWRGLSSAVYEYVIGIVGKPFAGMVGGTVSGGTSDMYLAHYIDAGTSGVTPALELGGSNVGLQAGVPFWVVSNAGYHFVSLTEYGTTGAGTFYAGFIYGLIPA